MFEGTHNMNTVVIIQARMGSTRLPGKVLMDLAGRPMLDRVVSRVRQATLPNHVVVATSTEQGDDELLAACNHFGWPCIRGSHLDVLDRFYQTARLVNADVIVRVTADCPLIDPAIIDQVVEAVTDTSNQVDYAANVLEPRTFPRGLDVEAFTFAALEKSWNEATENSCREHVTPWMYRNPDQFQLKAIVNSTDLSSYRWTVDTQEDLLLARTIFEHFGETDFNWQDVIEAWHSNPQWQQINSHIQQKVA